MMPTIEEEFAELKRQVAELKAEQARLRGEPPTPPRKPWPKWDPTEGMSMPPSAIREMVRVVGERRDVTNDVLRASPQPSSPPSSPPPWQPQPERPRGTGWQNDVPIGPPAGLRYIDQMLDEQDRRDRAALIAAERAHQQAILDAYAEAKLVDEQHRRAEAERSCHRGPGDPDFPASS
jgi:hypothetical protein